MLLDLTHCCVVPSDIAEQVVPVAELQTEGEYLIAQHPWAGYLRGERAFNWPRTFTRVGLTHEHYEFDSQFPAGTFNFKIKPEHQGQRIPIRCSFVRSGDPSSAVQGDLITYERHELVLPFKKIVSGVISVPDGVVGEYRKGHLWYHARDGWLRGVRRIVKAPEDANLLDTILDWWSAGRSFVRLEA